MPDYSDPGFQEFLRRQQGRGRMPVGPRQNRAADITGVARGAYNLGDMGYRQFTGNKQSNTVANGADILAILASLTGKKPLGAIGPGMNLWNRMNPNSKIPYSGEIGDVLGLYGGIKGKNPFSALASGGNLINRFNPGTIPGTDFLGGAGALYNIFRPGQDTMGRVMSAASGAPQLINSYNALMALMNGGSAAATAAGGGAMLGGAGGAGAIGAGGAEVAGSALGGMGAAWPLALIPLVEGIWDKQSAQKEQDRYNALMKPYMEAYGAAGGNIPLALAPRAPTKTGTAGNPIQDALMQVAEQEFQRLLKEKGSAAGIDVTRYTDPSNMLANYGQIVGASEGSPGSTEMTPAAYEQMVRDAIQKSVTNQYLQAFKQGKVGNNLNDPLSGFQYAGFNHPDEVFTPWDTRNLANPNYQKQAISAADYANYAGGGTPQATTQPIAPGATGFQSLYGIANDQPTPRPPRPSVYGMDSMVGA